MATQGIVSVVQDGNVVLKIVAGCDGYRAPLLAESLRSCAVVPDATDAYELAKSVGFGCERCLVAMDRVGTENRTGDDLSSLYRSTFSDPRFNPRWERGTASHVEIVTLGATIEAAEPKGA